MTLVEDYKNKGLNCWLVYKDQIVTQVEHIQARNLSASLIEKLERRETSHDSYFICILGGTGVEAPIQDIKVVYSFTKVAITFRK